MARPISRGAYPGEGLIRAKFLSGPGAATRGPPLLPHVASQTRCSRLLARLLQVGYDGGLDQGVDVAMEALDAHIQEFGRQLAGQPTPATQPASLMVLTPSSISLCTWGWVCRPG